MTKNCLKDLVLFFRSVLVFTNTADRFAADIKKAAEYCNKKENINLGHIGSVYLGTVSEIKGKKTESICEGKTTPKKKREYTENEMDALKQLDHENIVGVETRSFGARPEDGPVTQGSCLQSAAESEEHGSCIKESGKDIVFQVLKGIKHVHGNRMAHRNITPDSILVDTETF
ncbi:MAG: uncharacterized protein A8A55_3427, partial [Amphiamblys sp. WSBS2006]